MILFLQNAKRSETETVLEVCSIEFCLYATLDFQTGADVKRLVPYENV